DPELLTDASPVRSEAVEVERLGPPLLAGDLRLRIVRHRPPVARAPAPLRLRTSLDRRFVSRCACHGRARLLSRTEPGFRPRFTRRGIASACKTSSCIASRAGRPRTTFSQCERLWSG